MEEDKIRICWLRKIRCEKYVQIHYMHEIALVCEKKKNAQLRDERNKNPNSPDRDSSLLSIPFCLAPDY